MGLAAPLHTVDDRPLLAVRPVSVLLWDADGVLQHPRHEFADVLFVIDHENIERHQFMSDSM